MTSSPMQSRRALLAPSLTGRQIFRAGLLAFAAYLCIELQGRHAVKSDGPVRMARADIRR